MDFTEEQLKEMLKNLSKHKNAYVRAQVAEQGFALDKLIKDTDTRVRVGVVIGARKFNRKDLLNELIHDREEKVRYALVMQNYGLKRLCHDRNYWVKLAATTKLNQTD